MNILEQLDKLQRKAIDNEKVREALVETRKEKEPLRAFCRKARELGYEIYEMELVDAGELLCGNETQHQRRRRKFSHVRRLG